MELMSVRQTISRLPMVTQLRPKEALEDHFQTHLLGTDELSDRLRRKADGVLTVAQLLAQQRTSP